MHILRHFRTLLYLPLLFLSACTTQIKNAQNEASLQALPAPMSVNCPAGCPAGGSIQTITREAYTLNNNPDTKFANWVAYTITKTSQASRRPRNWKRDPALPESDTLSPTAYTGANGALAVDLGHQAPLASLGGTADWQSLNYLSNITPQKSALNRGPWARLEDKERALVNQDEGTDVHSVTGPLFETAIAFLPAASAVQIPSGYWKVIFIGSGPDKGKYAAFLMNQSVSRTANFCDYQVTVEQIEAKTNPHLNIWSSLPSDIAIEVKAMKGTLAKDSMGCQ
jgi:endonuclease G